MANKFTFLALTCIALLCHESIADTFGVAKDQFEIEFVRIGNAGPPPLVTYEFDIGKFEISRRQIELANELGDLEIEMYDMAGITGGPRPDMPASGISTNEAARFVNWLNESKGLPHAYKFALQPGEDGYQSNSFFEAWSPSDPGYDPTNDFRNSLAKYVIPTDFEWVKAAYYDANLDNGQGSFDGYRRWTETIDGEEFVTFRSFADGPNDVGEAGTDFLHGLVGIIGNVWELNETAADAAFDKPSETNQRLRGGAWSASFPFETPGNYGLTFYNITDYDSDFIQQGFRVASVPEPSGFAVWLPLLVLISNKEPRK